MSSVGKTADNGKNWPLVSILVLNYNGMRFVKECLESVFKTDYPHFEVIFIDNASTDGSAELVERIFSQKTNFKVIRNNSNLGFAGGFNSGLKAANGKYVIFLNNDTIVHPEWVMELIKVMQEDSAIALAQPNILPFDSPPITNKMKVATVDYLCIASGERTINNVERSFFCAVAFAAVKRVICRLGGFDEDFFICAEDFDLSWRVRLAGYEIVAVPSSIVYHYGGGTIGAGSLRQLYYFRRNHVMAMVKNYEFLNLVRYLPLYLSLVLAHAFYKLLIASHDVRYLLVCLKAFVWNIVNFRLIYRKRLEVQRRIRKISDENIKKCMTKPRIPWGLLY